MGSRVTWSWDLALLVALHALLLAAGGATVYLGFRLSASGWRPVARAAYAGDVTALEAGMLAVGCATVAAVAVGAGATYLRSRALLLTQALCLLLVLGGTIFLAARALVVYGRARDWRSTGDADGDWSAADASRGERLTANSFDARYCDAQRAFVCGHATLAQILALGLDNVTQLASSAGGGGSASTGGVGGLCDVSSGSGVETAYASVSRISSWIEDNCAYSAASIEWCHYTSGGDSVGEGDATGESPYANCRSRLLAQVEEWAEALGFAWSAVCALLMVLLLCVALLIRSRANANALDLEEAAASFQHDDVPSEERPQTSKA